MADIPDDVIEAVAREIFYGMKIEAWGRAEGTRRADAMWPADEKAWRAYPHNPVAEVDLAFAAARAAIAALDDARRKEPACD